MNVTSSVCFCALCISTFVGCGKSESRDEMAKTMIDEGKTDPKIHRIEDFHLGDKLSADEVLTSVGPPARYVGSGLTWFVYNLENGRELQLLFEFDSHDKSKLVAADLYIWRDGKNERIKRVFGDE